MAQRVRDTEMYITGTNTIDTADWHSVCVTQKYISGTNTVHVAYWHSTCVTQNCTSLAQILLIEQTGTARA